jgi:hypothetical protein
MKCLLNQDQVKKNLPFPKSERKKDLLGKVRVERDYRCRTGLEWKGYR